MDKLADCFGGSWNASGGMDHRVADRYRYVRVHLVHALFAYAFSRPYLKGKKWYAVSDLPACILAAG